MRAFGSLLRAGVLALAGALAAGAAGAQVLSPGATYDSPTPITKVSAYVFMDMRPELMPEAFRRTFRERLAKELARSGVPSQQVWFSDTEAGRDLIANPKAYTAARLTTIPIGKTVRENVAAERAFQASHWLLVYPTETSPSTQGAVQTVRWEFKDTHTGYISWAVYGVTHTLWNTMDEAKATQAANDFVDGMVAEMRRCKVIGDPKD